MLILTVLHASAFAKSNKPQDHTPKEKNKSEPTLVQADQLTYDQKTNIVTAIGHVEISNGAQILKADKAIYNRTKDTLFAEGHVSILQTSGEVVFSDTAEVTSDMKDGFSNNVGMLFPDNSRLSAKDAQRYEGRYLVADNGTYTSCDLCSDDPSKAPLWQIKGVRITHDNVEKNIMYRDAVIELSGVPVFYTPYLSQPDPTVTRRQGLLTASGGFSQNLGTFVRTPYYFDIAPSDDAVLTPTFSTIDKLQLAGEWRHRFTNGSMQWDGSFTHADFVDEFGVDQGNQWRGHLFGTTLFNLDNMWRAGTNVAFASDKSYLPRYSISAPDVLLNKAYIEGFNGRNYATANTYYFQDLRPGAQLAAPFVGPDAHFNALGEPGKMLGGRWSMDGGVLMTARDQSIAPNLQGPDTRRLSLDAGWERNFVSSTGFLTDLSTQVRADAYDANNVPDLNSNNTTFHNVTELRPFAYGNAMVRYPLGRRGDSYQQILEPIGMFTVAPNVSNSQKIPNEDSLDVNFDETNLFSVNHFTGIDLLDGGTRVTYGFRNTLVGDNGVRLETLAGQIYRFTVNNNFPVDSGLYNQLSDYVGRIDFSPGSWFDFNYGLRVDKSTYRIHMEQLQSSIGMPWFRPSINYLRADPSEATLLQTGSTSSALGTVEQATVGFQSLIAKYYTLGFSYLYAFQPNPGPRTTSASLDYTDECFKLGISVSRDDTNRLDIQSGTSVYFHFYLKNVGGIYTDGTTTPTFKPSAALTPPTASP